MVGIVLRGDPRLPVQAEDLLHAVLQSQLMELDLLLFDFVVLGEEGLLVDLVEPLLAGLMLFVQTPELRVGLDQFLFELVRDGHGRYLLGWDEVASGDGGRAMNRRGLGERRSQ
jgi:hypothetical protein